MSHHTALPPFVQTWLYDCNQQFLEMAVCICSKHALINLAETFLVVHYCNYFWDKLSDQLAFCSCNCEDVLWIAPRLTNSWKSFIIRFLTLQGKPFRTSISGSLRWQTLQVNARLLNTAQSTGIFPLRSCLFYSLSPMETEDLKEKS